MRQQGQADQRTEQQGQSDEIAGSTRRTLEQIADFPGIKEEWTSAVRKPLDDRNFSRIQLASDPLRFLALEFGIDGYIGQLVADLRDGTYRASPAVVLRGAKQSGLSRPLAELVPRDLLVVSRLIRPETKRLRAALGPSVGASKADKSKLNQADDVDLAVWRNYGSFFGLWLERNSITRRILEEAEFVVVSDISNFYGSLTRQRIKDHLLATTELGVIPVDLFLHVIESALAHPGYATDHYLGLPQSNFDSFRELAHSILVEIDQAFELEADEGLYARLMDDMVFGAMSHDAAEQLIARLLVKLQKAGLYPNASKTRIVDSEIYAKSLLLDHNDFLERVDDELTELESGPLRTLTKPYVSEDLVAMAASIRQEPGSSVVEKLWGRYYTTLRRVGDTEWQDHVVADIRRYPSLTDKALEYTRSFPLTSEMVVRLFELLEWSRHLYDDVPLLIVETLLTAPVDLDQRVQDSVVAGVKSLFLKMKQEGVAPRTGGDWILAKLVPVVSKFGTLTDLRTYRKGLGEVLKEQSVSWIHSYPYESGWHSGAAWPSVQLPRESMLVLDFIHRLWNQDEQAVRAVLSRVDPKVRLQPNRFVFDYGVLGLLDCVAALGPSKMSQAITGAIDKLHSNPERLVDGLLVSKLEQYR